MPLINGRLAMQVWGDSGIQQRGAVLETLFLYHYLNDRHRDIVPRLEKVLSRMLQDGTTKSIRGQYYADLVGEITEESRAQEMPDAPGPTNANLLEAKWGTDAGQLVFATMTGNYETEAAAAVLREAYARLGYEFEVRYYDGHEALIHSNAGLVDGELMRVDGINRQFENLVQIPIPVNYLDIVAFTRDQDFHVHGWSSLQPYRIGVIKSILAIEEPTRGMNRVYAASVDELVQLLHDEEIDIAPMPRTTGLIAVQAHPQSGVRELPGVLETIFIYHYLNAKNSHLVPDLERELKSMLLDGSLRRLCEQSYASLRTKES